MKEIGTKFQKFGRTALTTITTDITQTSQESLQVPKPQPDPTDNISLLTLNNCKLYIYSQKSSGMNLYRMLNYTKPSQILLQLRPDDVLPSNPSLEVGPEEVIQSSLSYRDCDLALKAAGFMISPTNIKVSGNAGMWRDRFGDRACIFSAIWAMQHDLDRLCLVDIPRSLFYRTLSNSLTLMQLQSMFMTTCKSIGAKPDTFGVEDLQVPLTAAYQLYPDVLDTPSVHFLAKNLLKASLTNKTVFCVAARESGQKAIALLKSKQKLINTDVPLFNTTIVRRESCEMVAEKLALLDTFSYGFRIPDQISTHSAFKRTNFFIKEILDTERAESNFTLSQKQYLDKKDMLTRLYLSKLKMYSSYGKKKVEEGLTDLRAEMLKTVIKSG